MAFQAGPKLPDFAKLKAVFVGARDQVKDYLLFQTIVNLLDANQRQQKIFSQDIEEAAASGTTNTVQFLPMTLGGEPIEFVSDGIGNSLLIEHALPSEP